MQYSNSRFNEIIVILLYLSCLNCDKQRILFHFFIVFRFAFQTKYSSKQEYTFTVIKLVSNVCNKGLEIWLLGFLVIFAFLRAKQETHHKFSEIRNGVQRDLLSQNRNTNQKQTYFDWSRPCYWLLKTETRRVLRCFWWITWQKCASLDYVPAWPVSLPTSKYVTITAHNLFCCCKICFKWKVTD